MANNAIFVKTLKKTDIAKRLAIPAKALRLLPNFEDSRMSIEVTDHEGLFWRFECSIRRIGHPRPVLAGRNWLAFVRRRNLKVGDKIRLYRERHEFREWGIGIFDPFPKASGSRAYVMVAIDHLTKWAEVEIAQLITVDKVITVEMHDIVGMRSNSLAIPIEALKLLPNFGDSHLVCIAAKDHNGFFWSFERSIRRNGHPRPFIACRNWLAFVRYWDLKVGDTIQLYRERDEFNGVEFRIVVQAAD
ncbi:hypothetical protein GH714_020689 [Hevea brasiliensis]|uniref:TF-B3 domain-containing protein n=1 Tax=Hevea brasiliensis TaxID=3981 RepID=A0A6A6N3P1_HEVBR|nr:hypothetical protein GH714_020689 [Hevea brasiliensis]